MKKNKQTIHKDNRIIKSKTMKVLSVHSLKIIDYLYYHTQKHLNEVLGVGENRKLTLKKDYNISIRQTTIREWLSMEEDKNYQKKIRESLKELEQPIDVYNFEENGELYTWGLKHFVKNVKEGINKEDNKTKIYYITIDKFLFNTILELKGNFTEIDLKYQKQWKSPNTLRLYQYLKSVKEISYNKELNDKWFNDFFNTKPLNQMSRIITFLNRHIEIINKDTDINIKLEVLDKRYKTFRFIVSNKKLGKTKKSIYAAKKNIKESELINKLLNK